jgi:hypothetical protein
VNLLGQIAIFAQVVVGPAPPAGSKIPRFLFSDVALIILFGIILMLLMIGWVVFVRGSKYRQDRAQRIYKRSSHRSAGAAEGSEEAEEDEPDDRTHSSNRRRKKKRSRRRDHRMRNPTLSQTGGLPPPRDPNLPASPVG